MNSAVKKLFKRNNGAYLCRYLSLVCSRSIMMKFPRKYPILSGIRSNRSFSTMVFSFGSGDDGQLGHPNVIKHSFRRTYEELTPVEIGAFRDVGIEKLSFGTTHSAAIDASGKMYTWGNSQYGKLGYLVNEKDTVLEPKLLEALKDIRIVDISCGEFHTAAIDEHGKMYTWGWGGSLFSGVGGLGHPDSATKETPTLVESFLEEGVRISKIGCGEMHTIALSDDRELWAWGNGEYGRLGNGGTSSAKVPEPVEFFSEMDCVEIACGNSFTLALSEDGSVYSWGKNDYGQLGLGGGIAMDVYSMENYPKLLEGLSDIKIVSIAAGNHHAAAITDDGRLYIWGMKTWLEPREMTSLHGYRIVAADCGLNFTAAIADTGELFTFGNGKTSCLGHGDRKTKQQPTLVESLSGFAVKSITCGSRHVGVVAEPHSTGVDKDFSFRK